MKTRWKEYKYSIYGGVVPFLLILFTLFVMQMRPFGQYSLFVSDLDAQYIDRITGFRNIIRGGKSFYYTWSQIQGSFPFSFLGWDPFYLIYAVVKEGHIIDMVTLVTAIKIGLAGLSCSIYLSHHFKKRDISISVFSWCYALMGFCIGYHFLLDFVNFVIMLPLLLYSVDRILKDPKHFLGCTLCLTQMFIMSYYMSYMCGIFAFLYFIYQSILKGLFENLKAWGKRTAAFLFSPILAFMCSGFVLIPIFSIMTQRDGLFDLKEMGGYLRYDAAGIISKLWLGSFDTVLPNGLPYLYCGLIVLILIGIYFSSYGISYKEKLISFSFVAFMIISLTVNPLYIAWQGFKPPIYFEARFSYMVSFLMILLGYKGFCYIKTITLKQLNYILAVILGALLFTNRYVYSFVQDSVVMYSVSFLVIHYIIFALWITGKCPIKKLMKYMALFVALELSMNSYQTMLQMDKLLHYPKAIEYETAFKKMKEQTQQLLENDKSFYRIEYTKPRGMNDGFGVGFPSIAHFDSVYNYEVKEGVGKLGLPTGHNWVKYIQGTPIIDTLLNVKYVMSDQKDYMGYKQKKLEEINQYENPFAISVGIMSTTDLNALEDKRPLLFQEEILNSMLGEKKKHYYKVLRSDLTKQVNLGVQAKEGVKCYYIKDDKQLASLSYKVEMKQGGACFLDLNTKGIYAIELKVNGQERDIKELDRYDNLYIGTYKKGEVLDVVITLKEAQLAVKEADFYELDTNLLEESIKELKENALRVNKHEDTLIEGNVQVTSERPYLYTSIPYDLGWSLYVDGKRIDTVPIMKIFLGAKLPVGTHDIVLKYQPKGYKAGICLTIVGVLVIICILFRKFIKK